MNQQLNLLIFGASGATGRNAVLQALEQGNAVTAFVRNPKKLNVSHGNLKIVTGDVTDANAVVHALPGHDVVISTLGAASPFRYDKNVVDGAANIVKAMENSSVKRLVYMSAINVGETRPDAGIIIRVLGPVLLRTETAGHEEREKIIMPSALDWTIVRCGTLNNGPHTGNYRSGQDVRAKGPIATISRADAADFLLKQVSDSTWLRKAVKVMY